MSNGKHYFDIDEVGKTVFHGSLGFRNDIKEYSRRHKSFNVVKYDEKEWVSGKVLIKIIRWFRRENISTQSIEDFEKVLKQQGIKATRKKWSPMVWKEIGFRQCWTCASCQEMLKPTFELDHIIELQDGGDDNMDNLQGLCVECHARKTRDRRLKEVVFSFKTSPLVSPMGKTSKYFEEFNYRPRKRMKLKN